MARFIKDRKASKGQIPGSLILIGSQKMDQPKIRLMEYNPENLVEKSCHPLRRLFIVRVRVKSHGSIYTEYMILTS